MGFWNLGCGTQVGPRVGEARFTFGSVRVNSDHHHVPPKRPSSSPLVVKNFKLCTSPRPFLKFTTKEQWQLYRSKRLTLLWSGMRPRLVMWTTGRQRLWTPFLPRTISSPPEWPERSGTSIAGRTSSNEVLPWKVLRFLCGSKSSILNLVLLVRHPTHPVGLVGMTSIFRKLSEYSRLENIRD